MRRAGPLNAICEKGGSLPQIDAQRQGQARQAGTRRGRCWNGPLTNAGRGDAVGRLACHCCDIPVSTE